MKLFETNNLKQFLHFPIAGKAGQNKFIIGAALTLAGTIIPILPHIPQMGYAYQTAQRVTRGEQPSMPEWNNWGRLFIDGLKMLGLNLLFIGPGLFVYMAGFTAYFVSVLSMSFIGNDERALIVLPFAMLFLFGGIFIGMFLMLLGAIPAPIAISHAIAKDRLSAALAVREWWPILRRAGGDYLIAWVVVFGIGSLLYTLAAMLYMSVILCMALPLVAGVFGFYLQQVAWALFAAVYHDAAGADGLPLPVMPVAPAPSTAASGEYNATPELIGVETAVESGQSAAELGEAAPLTARQVQGAETYETPRQVVEAFATELPAALVDEAMQVEPALSATLLDVPDNLASDDDAPADPKRHAALAA